MTQHYFVISSVTLSPLPEPFFCSLPPALFRYRTPRKWPSLLNKSLSVETLPSLPGCRGVTAGGGAAGSAYRPPEVSPVLGAGREVMGELRWISGLVFFQRLLLLVAMATSELEPPDNIRIRNERGRLVALWNWNNSRRDADTAVTFTALYNKSGESPMEIPGCVHTEEYKCRIPLSLLDVSESYTLLIRSELSGEDRLSNSIDFIPILIDVISDDGIFIVHILKSYDDSSYDLMDVSYSIGIKGSDSSVRTFISPSHQYVIPKTSPNVTYCVRVRIVNIVSGLHTPFSPETCFTTQPEGSPKNLRMEAIDSKYLLKWDWDYELHPNVTFSVEMREAAARYSMADSEWRRFASCVNITASECDVSVLSFYIRYELRTCVYDSQRDERNCSVVQFNAEDDAVMGPPTSTDTRILSNELYISVSPPEGLKDEAFSSVCDWMYHLEFWNNATQGQVKDLEKREPNFHIKALNSSTTYCVRARTKCDNKTGLYGDIQCVTTDPRSYVTELVIGFTILGIIVMSVVVYICVCPLKRYMRHIFYPSSKLPSSIGKDLQDSSRHLIKVPLSLHTEETFDKCYIIQNAEPEIQVQMDKTSQDSGNYSNEEEITGDTNICTE